MILEFPVRGVSNDLESAARVPGEESVLLVESHDGGDHGGDTGDAEAGIYLASFAGGAVRVESYTRWPDTPEPLVNVESTAVAAVGEDLYFLYAERASGEQSTTIHWTTLDIDADRSLVFGSQWGSTPFTRPGPPGARPASGLEIAADGSVLVASAYDSDDDNGPFDSAVWRVGTWATDGTPGIERLGRPEEVARATGFKIESVAVTGDGSDVVYIGLDDENYGGTLRPLRATDDT